jgi:hypothetical protein
VPALLAEVTWAREIAVVAEAARAAAMLTAEASAQKVVVAWYSTTLCVKDVLDWAPLAEREAL